MAGILPDQFGATNAVRGKACECALNVTLPRVVNRHSQVVLVAGTYNSRMCKRNGKAGVANQHGAGNLAVDFGWSTRQTFQHCFKIKIDFVQAFLQTFEQEGRLTGFTWSKTDRVVSCAVLAVRAQTVKSEF